MSNYFIIGSINAESSGYQNSCVVKDKNNTIYNVNLQGSRLINSTETGCLCLHEKDLVKIFYNKDKSINDYTISAETVYIKTTEYRMN